MTRPSVHEQRVFLALREHFFDDNVVPRPYSLRDKRNTQDDPLDEHIHHVLQAALSGGVEVETSGPLTTPDLVVYRPGACGRASRTGLRADSKLIFALEVKKLERTESGRIARASGLDYNTTPPCGTVRVYDSDGVDLDIKGCYLFVCQEPVPAASRTYRLTALALCDGDLLNEDFGYYVSIVGRRSKEIGLGTYGDGANRFRPMLIFPNPLGAPFLDHRSTLVHARSDLDAEYPGLCRVGAIERSVRSGGRGGAPMARQSAVSGPADEDQLESRTFHCYRDRRDVPNDSEPFRERDPFPTPQRSSETAPRGRFVVNIRPSS